MLDEGVEMVVCTGGMSVDPDDRTPLAIRNTGARIVSYGAPVLPGAMFLISYMPDGRPVCGLRDVSCMQSGRFSIFVCRIFSRMNRLLRMIWRTWATAVFA